MLRNPHERAELAAHLCEQLHAIRGMLASPSPDLDRFVALNTSAGVLALVRAGGVLRFGLLTDPGLVLLERAAGVLALVRAGGVLHLGLLTDPGLVLLERNAIEVYRKAWNARREVRANTKTVTVYRLRDALELDLANLRDLRETVKGWQP